MLFVGGWLHFLGGGGEAAQQQESERESCFNELVLGRPFPFASNSLPSTEHRKLAVVSCHLLFFFPASLCCCGTTQLATFI